MNPLLNFPKLCYKICIVVGFLRAPVTARNPFRLAQASGGRYTWYVITLSLAFLL